MEFLDGFDPTPRLTRVIDAARSVARRLQFLPGTPLASHGDHLPTAMRQEPLQFPIIDDRQPRLEFVD